MEVFDTTYRTYRYNMICAPFVGVNHHWKNVLFGCAFLLDEKTDSFIWLFETFLESMGGRKPKTIFTDQCQAMANGIEKVFPGVCHRLCSWHISQNAARNLGSYCGNPEFNHMFNKCLQGYCETKLKFQSTWDDLLAKFNLTGNMWLKTLYSLRAKWCQYLANIFSLLRQNLHKEVRAQIMFVDAQNGPANIESNLVIICAGSSAGKRAEALAHPQSNGQVEAVNKIIKKTLKTAKLDKAKGCWPELLPGSTLVLPHHPSAHPRVRRYSPYHLERRPWPGRIGQPTYRTSAYDARRQ
ncbi:FAR1-related sequence 5 [Prunus dulcis]|uniref:FAR1-related sequence 5 n=1 Tax=Prunus dulcis TaxID=3755 RepID=A0A4Y1RGG9_PRUDU|nr:FAR1-related sequence 5 [Prunus dulcis]